MATVASKRQEHANEKSGKEIEGTMDFCCVINAAAFPLLLLQADEHFLTHKYSPIMFFLFFPRQRFRIISPITQYIADKRQIDAQIFKILRYLVLCFFVIISSDCNFFIAYATRSIFMSRMLPTCVL